MSEFNVFTKEDLRNYLYDGIPLVSAMQLDFIRMEPGVVEIASPMEENSNDKGTAFAGSIYANLVLSGWSLVFSELKQRGIDCDVVIADSSVEYFAPITERFVSRAVFSTDTSLDEFIEKVRNGKKPGIRVESTIHSRETLAVHFKGRYHAWRK